MSKPKHVILVEDSKTFSKVKTFNLIESENSTVKESIEI